MPVRIIMAKATAHHMGIVDLQLFILNSLLLCSRIYLKGTSAHAEIKSRSQPQFNELVYCTWLKKTDACAL